MRGAPDLPIPSARAFGRAPDLLPSHAGWRQAPQPSPQASGPLEKARKSQTLRCILVHPCRPARQERPVNPHDFPDTFGLRNQRLPRHPFFIDNTTDRAKLGIILIDHNAHERRVVQKTLNPLGRFLRHGWFDEFIRAESFIVAVLTFTSGRSRVIAKQLLQSATRYFRQPLSRLRPDLGGRLPLDLQVHLIPGMDALVLPLTKRKENQ